MPSLVDCSTEEKLIWSLNKLSTKGLLKKKRGEPTTTKWKQKKKRKQHQLSADNCASMSTLQMGHFLLVRSHWSTHSWWKRCIHGRRLETEQRHKVRTRFDFLLTYRTQQALLQMVTVCPALRPHCPIMKLIQR